MEEKRKREGAVAMTILMLPAAPTAAKNIWQVKHQQSIRTVGLHINASHAVLTECLRCQEDTHHLLHSHITEQVCCVRQRLNSDGS